MAQKCGCIRNDYDFSLKQDSCSKITYTDHSTFQTGAEYTSTPSYTLNVTLPDGSLKTYTVTVGTPLELELGDCVQSGIAEFSVISCDKKFTKRAALTCQIWCGYLRVAAIHGIGSDKLKSIREDIQDAELTAATDFITAAKLIEKIDRELDRLNCRCSC